MERGHVGELVGVLPDLGNGVDVAWTAPRTGRGASEGQRDLHRLPICPADADTHEPGAVMEGNDTVDQRERLGDGVGLPGYQPDPFQYVHLLVSSDDPTGTRASFMPYQTSVLVLNDPP